MSGKAQRERASHTLPDIHPIQPGEEPVDLEILGRTFAEAMKMMGWGASPSDAIKKCIGPGLTHLVEHVGRLSAPSMTVVSGFAGWDTASHGQPPAKIEYHPSSSPVLDELERQATAEDVPQDDVDHDRIRTAINAVLEEKGKVRWDHVAKLDESLASADIQTELGAMHAEGLLADPNRGWYGAKE